MSARVSGFDNSQVLKSRLFGGTAIMWKKNVNAVTKAVSVDSNKIAAVTVVIENFTLLLFIVHIYMLIEDGTIGHVMNYTRFSIG